MKENNFNNNTNNKDYKSNWNRSQRESNSIHYGSLLLQMRVMRNYSHIFCIVIFFLSMVGTANATIWATNSTDGWRNITKENTVIRGDQNISLDLLNNDYISWWDMRTNSSSRSTLFDINRSSSQDGNIIGAVSWNGDRGLNFANNYIDMNLSEGKLPSNFPFSIVVDADASSTSTNYLGGFFNSTSSTIMYSLFDSSSKTSISLTNGIFYTGTIATNNRITEVGVWRGSGNRSLYSGGILDLTNTTSYAFTPINRISIGHAGDSTPAANFSGKIYNFIQYNRELTGEEIINSTKYYLNGNITTWNTFEAGKVGNKVMINIPNLDTNITADLYASIDNFTSSSELIQSNITSLTWYQISTAKNQTQYIRIVLHGNLTDSPDFTEISISDIIPGVSTPNITSWGNNFTNDDLTSFSVERGTNITFNGSINQTLDNCIWTGASQINCSSNTYAYKLFDTIGTYSVEVYGENTNGTSNTISWNINVTDTPHSVSGYIFDVNGNILNRTSVYNTGRRYNTTTGYYIFSDIVNGTALFTANKSGYSNTTISTIVTGDLINQNITMNTGYSKVAPYANIQTGSGNWGASGASNRSFFTNTSYYRIRQNGNITNISIYTNNIINLTGFYITIWRENTTKFDRVGISENLILNLTADTINKINLTTQISAQEGDYYGYDMIYDIDNGFQNLYSYTCTGCQSRYITNSVYSINNFDWNSATSSINVVPIEIYMESPDYIFIGDSIIAGHNSHYSFIENSVVHNINSTIEHHFFNLSNSTYQNMGYGGQTSTQIAARFQNDIINLNPKNVIIEGGINDIAGGIITQSTFINNYMSMFNLSNNSNLDIIILNILPCSSATSCSNENMIKRDEWQTNLTSIINSDYSWVKIVDASTYVGVERVGGSPTPTIGNYWNIQAIYDLDNVHYNSNGHNQIAQAIFDVIFGSTSNSPIILSFENNKTDNVSKEIILNSSESIKFNATANQTITTWTWAVNGSDKSINYDNYTTTFNTTGLKNVSVNATNTNGTSNTIYWNISIIFPTSPCGNFGDLDNDGFVTDLDVTILNNNITNPGNPIYALTDIQKIRADVTGNGVINIGDSITIQNYIDDSISRFVACNVPMILSFENNKTSNNTKLITINSSESIKFNATANQTISNWLWAINGTNQSNNYDNYSISWNTGGFRNISVNATSASDNTNNTIYWNVTVILVADTIDTTTTTSSGGSSGISSIVPITDVVVSSTPIPTPVPSTQTSLVKIIPIEDKDKTTIEKIKERVNRVPKIVMFGAFTLIVVLFISENNEIKRRKLENNKKYKK